MEFLRSLFGSSKNNSEADATTEPSNNTAPSRPTAPETAFSLSTGSGVVRRLLPTMEALMTRYLGEGHTLPKEDREAIALLCTASSFGLTDVINGDGLLGYEWGREILAGHYFAKQFLSYAYKNCDDRDVRLALEKISGKFTDYLGLGIKPD